MIVPSKVREVLRSADWLNEPFQLMKDLSIVCGRQEEAGRELVVYALEYRDQLPVEYQNILDNLAMKVGLHPYVKTPQALSLSDALQHAAHTGEGLLEDLVFHSSQVRIFEKLLDGQSIALSAPTSYGKSLLIDAYIAASSLQTVIIIVPTIALIEETRRRMARFSDQYKLITSRDQLLSEKNIVILTQERYLSMRDELPKPDFFVIDEFYKLDPASDSSRANLLNQALLHLVDRGSQFYLLGPSIHAVTPEVLEKLDCEFVHEEFHTVALDLHYLSKERPKAHVLADTLNEIDGQTLVYCRSPASTRRVSKELIAIQYQANHVAPELIEASNWTAENFHSQWLVSQALRYGIGIHHGRIPRALARFMVRVFEEGMIKVLLCTSTLIEGVNTAARNVVIFDNKIEQRNLDFFTFNNIRGRSGRMFRHFVGHIYVFDPPPERELPLVDVPAFNPTIDTPSSLLIHKSFDELPPDVQTKIRPVLDQDIIPIELLRQHSAIEPEAIIHAGAVLRDLPEHELHAHAWAGVPTYDELKATAALIWEELKGAPAARKSAIYSAEMMTYWVWDLYRKGDVGVFRREMIANQIASRGLIPDEAVENVLLFLRNWASFHFPKYLMAANDIVQHTLGRRGMGDCDYSPFAAQMENLFQPHTFLSLEEYGLPVEVSVKLTRRRVFDRDDNLDQAIDKIRSIGSEDVSESLFERGVMADFLSGI